MPKKKTTARNVPRSGTPRTFSESAPAEAGSAAQPAAAANGSATRPGVQDSRRRVAPRTEARVELPLSQEYAYVPGDLKRLGLMAVGMVALMLVLGVILR
jgi:hypothetical protein